MCYLLRALTEMQAMSVKGPLLCTDNNPAGIVSPAEADSVHMHASSQVVRSKQGIEAQRKAYTSD